MTRPVSEGGPYNNPKTIWLNEEQKRLVDSWGKEGVEYLRLCINNRGVGDKDEIMQRISAIDEEMAKLNKEKQQLQSHLEDFIAPKDERVQAVVKRFFELGMQNCDTFTQKGWLMGPAQLGNDDVAFEQAWNTIQGKNDEGEGWGGD